ncbi:MAG TPA: universal stress protein [Steroidobacteraceae bacterium]|nr:universal stress protein [Steroidobacteraceae bacterium]
MNRISHILVVVDPSTKDRQAAVDKAAQLARCSNATVELLICEIASALNDQAPAGARHPQPDNTELLDLLEGLAGPLHAQGIKVSVRIIYGRSFPDTLLDYLLGSNADLVVKDTHQHSFARRAFARNTDWHLVRGCAKPLLLTKKRPWSQPPMILTAVDLQPAEAHDAVSNKELLKFVATFSSYLKGDLHIVHSYIPTAFAALVRAGGQALSRDYSESLQVENAFRYCQMESLGSAYGISPQHLHVEMGTPHDCLKQMVERFNTDLVVMGASSHKWRRMFIGSTAATILESLDCDILIIGTSELTQSGLL